MVVVVDVDDVVVLEVVVLEVVVVGGNVVVVVAVVVVIGGPVVVVGGLVVVVDEEVEVVDDGSVVVELGPPASSPAVSDMAKRPSNAAGSRMSGASAGCALAATTENDMLARRPAARPLSAGAVAS